MELTASLNEAETLVRILPGINQGTLVDGAAERAGFMPTSNCARSVSLTCAGVPVIRETAP